MRVLYILSIVLFFSFLSCKTETIQCGAAGLQIYFVGFTFNEANTATVFVYKQDNLFDSLVDSEAMHCEQVGTSDTIMMLSAHALDDGHDYQVKLSGSGTVHAITGLTPGNHYTDKIQTGIGDELDYLCSNNTVSYTLDGQQFGQPGVMSGVYNIAYIQK